MSNWQSALILPPRNRTVIAQFVYENGVEEFKLCQYFAPFTVETDYPFSGWADYNEDTDKSFCPSGWYEQTEGDDGCTCEWQWIAPAAAESIVSWLDFERPAP